MANEKNLKPFKKGDPRINRLGRPKTFQGLKVLAQEIAHEVAQSGGRDLIIDGHKVTNAEAVLRKWLVSGNPQLQRAFMEIAFGKVPDITQVSGPGGGPIQTEDVTLSDIERVERVASILDTARARKAGQASSDPAGEVQE